MIVVAVVASIATSRPRWHLVVDLPVVVGGKQALELTVDSTQDPHVTCVLPDGDHELRPHRDGNVRTYVCPPGGQFVGPIAIYGNASGGCGAPKPPDGEYIRVVKLVPVDTWSVTASGEVPFTREEYDANYGGATVFVHGPPGIQAIITVDAPELGVPQISGNGLDGTFRITARYRDPQKPQAMIAVRATAYGTGPQPPDAAVTVDGNPEK